MTFRLGNLVKETTTTTGTGALTLLGASSGYRAFSAVCSDGDTVPYMIGTPGDANREVGLGTWNTGGILSRSAVLESSNSNNLVSLPSGTKQVSLVMPADMMGITNSECGGRLSLISGDPFGIGNTTNTIVYWTPARSAEVTLYYKLLWQRFYFTEISYTLSGTSADSNYDLFVWNNSGTITLSRGPAWTSNTARGTGAGTTELWMFEGVLVNVRDISGGPGAFAGRYVGTFRTTATANQTSDTPTQRFLANLYHSHQIAATKLDSTSHTFSNASQQWTATLVQWIQALESYVRIRISARTSTFSDGLYLYPELNGSQTGGGNDFAHFYAVATPAPNIVINTESYALAPIGLNSAAIQEGEFSSINATLDYGRVYVELWQ